jgi:hypothetical protein
LLWKPATRISVLGVSMVHWNNLSGNAQQLLRKLVEGCYYDPADEHLAELVECGLIEESADGWQVTSAGRSAYVVRDQLPKLSRHGLVFLVGMVGDSLEHVIQ